jgi:anti-sigma factor RsiW
LSDDAQLLLSRYVDGELSAAEAEGFRARLAADAALCRQARSLERLGLLLRAWAGEAQARCGDLVEPTLERVRTAQA